MLIIYYVTLSLFYITALTKRNKIFGCKACQKSALSFLTAFYIAFLISPLALLAFIFTYIISIFFFSKLIKEVGDEDV